MTRAEFSRRILDMGGTYADVNRLEEEGYKNALDAHAYVRPTTAASRAEFDTFCYDIGREFVLDNMGDLFQLENPENAVEQSKINKWNYAMQSIKNIGLNLILYGGTNQFNTDGISWSDVATAQKILEDLREICKFANIEIKEM